MSENRAALYEAIEKFEKEKDRLNDRLEVIEVILSSLYHTRDNAAALETPLMFEPR